MRVWGEMEMWRWGAVVCVLVHFEEQHGVACQVRHHGRVPREDIMRRSRVRGRGGRAPVTMRFAAALLTTMWFRHGSGNFDGAPRAKPQLRPSDGGAERLDRRHDYRRIRFCSHQGQEPRGILLPRNPTGVPPRSSARAFHIRSSTGLAARSAWPTASLNPRRLVPSASLPLAGQASQDECL